MRQSSILETPAPVGGPDRRERKKRQTREALMRAALELFDAKGYEQTTVREITDAVDVSTRTFFRYFASKEDLVVSFASEFSADLLDEIRARPAEETPFEAMNNSFTAVLREYRKDRDASDAATIYLSIVRLVENTPPLLAAYLRDIHDSQAVLAATLAEREGIDPATDLRPELAAAMQLALVSISVRRALTDGDAGIDEILDEFDASLKQLGSALSGHWTAGSA